MPNVLAEHDCLIISSEYEEPLARSMVEAMAMGLLVVGTVTGGSGELLSDQATGLVHEKGNSEELSRWLVRAVADPTWAVAIAATGQHAVRERFDIRETVQRIEAHLGAIAGNPNG